MLKKRFRIAILIALSAVVLWLVIAPPRFVSELRFVFRHAQLGTTLVAKDLCYGIFLQDREPDDIRSAELGPYLDPRLSWVKADLDTGQREVRTSMFGLFSARVAQRADGSCGRDIRQTSKTRPRIDLTPDPKPWPEGDGLAPDARQRVTDYEALEAAVAAEFRPTASGLDRGTRSVLVVHQGRLVYQRHAEGWNRTVPQNGRSMSKAMAAILAGMVAGQGKLGLEDDHLREEWTDERRDITLANLLQMQSGLEWQEANGPGDGATAQLLVEDAADYIATKPLAEKPGATFKYSSGDVDLSVAVAQARSGMDDETWAGYPYRALFEPLNMHRTVLDRTLSGQFIVSTSMHAAALDWARLGLFLARDGVWNGRRLLPEGWVDFMRTPTPESRCNYGATVWIRGGCQDLQPSEVFELSGFMGQGVTIVPETETIIVRTGFGPWIMGDLLERVFPALGVEAPTRMAMETD